MRTKVSTLLPEIEPFSPTEAGAIARWVYETNRLMHGFDFTVFAPASTKEFIGFPLRHLHSSKLFEFGRGKRVAEIIYCWEAGFKMRDCAIVHIHNRPRYVRRVKHACRNAKIILHMHNDHLLNLGPKDFEKTVSNSDAIIAVSRYIANGILEREPALEKKVHVLYNGTRIDKFRPQVGNGNPVGGPVILFVGRLIPEKGILELIMAMKLVLQEFPAVRLRIVGSSWFGKEDQTPYVQKLLQCSEEISHSIEFTGFIPNDELPQIYASCDLFVAPSIWNEPFGITILDAMASGLPCISSSRGGIPEVVGDAGILVAPEDIVVLGNEIVRVLKDKDLGRELGMQARRRAEEYFSWERTADGLNQIFTEIL